MALAIALASSYSTSGSAPAMLLYLFLCICCEALGRQDQDLANCSTACIVNSSHETAMLKIALMYMCRVIGVVLAATPVLAAEVNDYPTEARADYVYVCMKTNGETRDILKRCSCSIDVIASLLPYDRFVAAETVASMDQALGQIGTLFRNSPQTKATSDELRRAQAEAEVRCF